LKPTQTVGAEKPDRTVSVREVTKTTSTENTWPLVSEKKYIPSAIDQRKSQFMP
jgi:hypothetical protein